GAGRGDPPGHSQRAAIAGRIRPRGHALDRGGLMSRPSQRLPKSHPRTTRKKARTSGASASRPLRTIPGWLWLVAGVGVGMLVTSLIKLADVPPPATDGATVQSTPAKVPAPKPVKSETQFDFYTLLP